METKDDANKDTAASAAPATTPTTARIELDTPLQRAGKAIHQVEIRKPLAGGLRGVTLVDVLQMDVTALTKVLPRITEPALTEAEIRTMDPADIVQLGAALADFLTAKKFKVET